MDLFDLLLSSPVHDSSLIFFDQVRLRPIIREMTVFIRLVCVHCQDPVFVTALKLLMPPSDLPELHPNVRIFLELLLSDVRINEPLLCCNEIRVVSPDLMKVTSNQIFVLSECFIRLIHAV